MSHCKLLERRLMLGAALLSSALLSLACLSASAFAGTETQEVVVNWSGGHYQRVDQASFAIPSVGTGEITCRPNTTWIQMTPSNPNAENDMWSVKTELKGGKWSTSVKNARVYRFSTPTSTVPYGSGVSAFEGFNQFTPIESESNGSSFGIISTRGALNAPAGQGATPTSFTLNWYWKNFYTSQAKCYVKATFRTQTAGKLTRLYAVAGQPTKRIPVEPGVATSLTLNWHGEAEAPLAAARPRSLTLPGLGVVEAECNSITAGAERSLLITPVAGATPYVVAETYQGEGYENATNIPYLANLSNNTVGPISLPMNGITHLAIYSTPGAKVPTSEAVFSSYAKINDPNPANNYCEVTGEAVTK